MKPLKEFEHENSTKKKLIRDQLRAVPFSLLHLHYGNQLHFFRFFVCTIVWQPCKYDQSTYLLITKVLDSTYFCSDEYMCSKYAELQVDIAIVLCHKAKPLN